VGDHPRQLAVGHVHRQLIHFGFTQDEANRKVYDGAWPIHRGAPHRPELPLRQARLVMKLYEAGSEGPLWWERWPDHVRGLPAGNPGSMQEEQHLPEDRRALRRCRGLGAEADDGMGRHGRGARHPAADNVRRYYFASSPHGGGSGGFRTAANPGSVPACNSNN